MSITVIGGAILVGFALINDPSGAVKLVTAIITVRGITWICTKITNINKDASEMINMTGWCLATVPLVGLVKLALKGLPEIVSAYTNFANSISKAADWIDHLPIIGGK